MTEPARAPDRDPNRTRIGMAVIAAIAVAMALIGGPFEQLLLGWIYFPLRVVPRMTPDWPAVALGGAALVAFVAVFHVTLTWFRGATTASDPTTPTWTLRSTIVATGIVLLTFAAGTAMVGATHQFVWIVTGRTSTVQDALAQSQLRLPSPFATARDLAIQDTAKFRLRDLSIGTAEAASTYHALPPGGTINENGELLHGWPTYIGMFAHYHTEDVDFKQPWNASPNDRLFKCQLHTFVNPALPGPWFDRQGYGLIHWSANERVMPIKTVKSSDWRFAPAEPKIEFSSISDGAANTILLGSVTERIKPWGHPANVRDPALGINQSPQGFGGPRSWRGAMFAMADGSVRMINEKTDPAVMKALATPSGGETLPANSAR